MVTVFVSATCDQPLNSCVFVCPVYCVCFALLQLLVYMTALCSRALPSLCAPLSPLPAAVAGVHDGYVLTKSISRSPVGGKLLNTCLQNSLQARNIQIRPRQTFKRVEKKPGEFVVRVGFTIQVLTSCVRM
jgi:hypothetical protein